MAMHRVQHALESNTAALSGQRYQDTHQEHSLEMND